MPLAWTYAVTFESTTQPPETLRGTVTGTASGAASRAIRVAKGRKPTRHFYQSLVVVLGRAEGLSASADAGKARRATNELDE